MANHRAQDATNCLLFKKKIQTRRQISNLHLLPVTVYGMFIPPVIPSFVKCVHRLPPLATSKVYACAQAVTLPPSPVLFNLT